MIVLHSHQSEMTSLRIVISLNVIALSQFGTQKVHTLLLEPH